MNAINMIFPLLLTPTFLFAFAQGMDKFQIYPLMAVIAIFSILFMKVAYDYRSEIRSRQKSESNYHQLFENLPEGLLFVDEYSTIQRVNNTFSKITGYSKNELLLSNVYALSPDIQPETGFFSDIALKMFIEKAKSGQNQHFEWYLTRSDGNEFPIEVLLTKLEDSEQFLFIARDISEIKKLQQEKEFQNATLIQQSKLAELGNMIGAIAHQWKQPLNVIGIISQDLPEAYAFGELDEKRTAEISSSILEQVRFMSQTIDDFRNFYKPSKEAVAFDVSKAISGVVSLLKTQLNKHNIAIDLISDEASQLKAIGYENEFKQVILNLITNVKDVADEKSLMDCRIEISTKLDGQKIVVYVHDNAGGIPDKLLPTKIFEPFVSTKADRGTGIGLALAKTIIEDKMHGKISVENVDAGARFTIEMVASKENQKNDGGGGKPNLDQKLTPLDLTQPNPALRA